MNREITMTLALAVLLTSSAYAQPTVSVVFAPSKPVAKLTIGDSEIRLKGLDAVEAAALIDKLRDLQNQLKGGTIVVTRILSGAVASDPMAKVAPRDAFLGLDFEQTFEIERVSDKNAGWKPLRLTITPNGLGQKMWFVEVDLGFSGKVERIEMLYKEPPPF